MIKKFFKYLFLVLHFCIKNIIRLIFLITVLFVLATSIAWFIALKYFNADNIGAAIARELQNSFQRPVVIGSIKLVSINSVEIKNLKVADTRLNGYDNFLSADSVIIRYNLLPLLKNEIEIKEVVLQNPVINIIKDDSGMLNIPDFKTSSRQSSSGQQFDAVSAAGRSLRIVVEDWIIKNGTLSYRDLGREVSHSLNGINIHFYNLKFNAPTDYNLSFVLRNKIKDRITETEVRAKGKVNLANFKLSQMSLENTKASLGAFKEPITLTLSANDFTAPQVALKMSVPAFSYGDVSLLMPKPLSFMIPATEAEADLKFENNFKKITFSMLKLKNKDMNLNFTGDLDLQVSPSVFKGNFATGEFDLASSDYFGLWQKYNLKGKASASGSLVYSDGHFTVPALRTSFKGLSSKVGNFTFENMYGKYEAADNFNTTRADINDGVFKVGRQTVSRINGAISYDKNRQSFASYLSSAMFNDKRMRMRVAIFNMRKPQDRMIRADLYLSTFDPMEIADTVEDFVRAINPKYKPSPKETGTLAWLHNFKADLPKFMPNFSGFLYAEHFTCPILSGRKFNAEFRINGMAPGMDKLNGRIDAKLESGIIYKLQEAAEKQEALGIAFQPFVIMNRMERAGSFKMGQVLKDTPFDTMAVSADFNNGKMNINNFYVDGGVVAATIGGYVDWTGEKMDLDIATMFKNTSKHSALSENLTDDSGDPALAFRSQGDMKKPVTEMLSPKKTGEQIKRARKKGLRTSFVSGQKFIKEK